ncbi:MAG: DSBA oxidoreductase [Candidatus Yanofskybacteria bacterium GW2011_GWA1_44_21]|uniref:Thioredoxin domain-containing protein n=2 Tax=Candidatus Yanofskyibacteriota TaxID=1752733 RepID=A0A1F8H1V6_9BACT|nr:MAG: DSBA oxidoreductase [Candidatus Yanofskybacteria bacterium GW2011_GWA2_44_10]KKT50596.1 MAG: DSBA oxidoreductase [Candidatus Yanofskybacteria bacterium GW2011_GWA1_44_21]KKT90110.1 MAG: DSBA oxidoreductase [Candidatus Yanofskybacteria bacterium GW2011_GWB1_45_11]OGN02775.1 MAG: hypothetical protein A2657_01370 [Candidatus Yanofskybacteria bacterium RIFCSPHIGHO2_01_FULL_44_110b]OGN14648.1 MAG: hypothetical protein A3C01_03115 [Candidatus Yanofskybacteria bacterium RIFCSPHIGHO2_02_FULL_44
MDEIQNSEAGSPKWNRNWIILSGSILAAAVMISSSLLYSREFDSGKAQIAPENKIEVSADDDPYMGSDKAEVLIIEFSDFQCPYCRSFSEDTLPQLKKEYIDTGKARLVYRDFPLSFHAGAEPAAQAGQCAWDQGKFWEFHDTAFAEQAKQGNGTISFGVKEVKKWAATAGLNMTEFNSCFDSGKYREEVAKDFADGGKAGVSGTPTFFINGTRIVGAQPYEVFKSTIDRELE